MTYIKYLEKIRFTGSKSKTLHFDLTTSLSADSLIFVILKTDFSNSGTCDHNFID